MARMVIITITIKTNFIGQSIWLKIQIFVDGIWNMECKNTIFIDANAQFSGFIKVGNLKLSHSTSIQVVNIIKKGPTDVAPVTNLRPNPSTNTFLQHHHEEFIQVQSHLFPKKHLCSDL